MQSPLVLPSCQDDSVNFVSEYAGETVEARYVRRVEDYFIVYLSSQTGCKKACRFCHLTQTGQTTDTDVPVEGLFEQADTVLAHYDSLSRPARMCHFNFMARGEVLASQEVHRYGDQILDGLSQRALDRGLVPAFKLSTIMPVEMADIELADLFPRFAPDIYYSLYSMDPAFRRRWMPKAIDPHAALGKLRRWQDTTRKVPVLHWAFIEGANDSEETIVGIVGAVHDAGLRVDVNIVRYNPFSDKQGAEPDLAVIERNAALLREGLPGAKVQIVGRVGYDVKASCGMFVGGRQRG